MPESAYIYWVPGQKGVSGNEITDVTGESCNRLIAELVKEIHKSLKTILNQISKSTDGRSRVKYNGLEGCRIAKIMCKVAEGKHASFLLTLSRKTAGTRPLFMSGLI